MRVFCDYCQNAVDKTVGHVNRARKVGLKIYCDRKCAGLGRRINRTIKEKRELKRLYDIERRKDPVIQMYQKLRALAYNESPAGRAMQKRNREKFKAHHLEYCRTNEYRQWKRLYDESYRAKKNYGEFWESAIVLKDIDKIIAPEKYQIRIQNKTLNKSQKRKRAWNSLQKTLKRHYGTP